LRGGKAEKALPDLIKLTEEQFDVFLKKTLLNGFADKVIKEILPPEPAGVSQGSTTTADKNTVNGNAQSHGNPAPKPAGAERNAGANVAASAPSAAT
jgi:hypothetical protein